MIRRFLREFMVGRYGFDKLSFALTLLGCILNLLISVLRVLFSFYIRSHVEVYILFRILSFMSYIPYAIALFRILSRNFEKRKREEAAFMKVAGKWIALFTKKLIQKKDVNHRYFNCPSCHRTLRVPKGRGRIKIDCPHCSRQFFKRT